jgi:cell division protein FtsZ
MTPSDSEQLKKYESSQERSEKIIAIGVGGGGGNAVNYMFHQHIDHVAFYVANTDKQDLDNSPVPNKILLGPTVTKGRGAGNKPEVAKEAAEESALEIDDIFQAETDMVFITAGMGGGTGTGAAPVIARIARERNILTVGIVTIPFLFEGMKKIQKAVSGADELGKYVDALLVINNDRLGEIYPDYSFENAFEKADDILSTAAASISEIITKRGKINLDFNDVNTTLRDGGTAIISIGYGEGENRVTKAIQDALNSPLLKYTDVYSSKRLLFNLYYNPNAEQKFLAKESQEFADFVTKMVADVDVIWGLTYDESLGDKVKVTILASGFDLTVTDDVRVNQTVTIEGKEQEKPVGEAKVDSESLKQYYGDDKINEYNRTKETQRYIILSPDQLDNDEILDSVEKSPAYNRDMRVINKLRTESKLANSHETTIRTTENQSSKTENGNHVIDFSNEDF